MKPGGARAKGHAFERWVAAQLREAAPGCDAKRGFQTRGGGKEEADVMVPLLHIECKHGAKPNPRAALAQAENDCPESKWPVAIVKDNRKEPFVVMRFDNWLALAADYMKGERDA